MNNGYTVAVVGAMGLVGSEMIRQLEKRKFPVKHLKPMDVKEYEGNIINFNNRKCEVLLSEAQNFIGVDIALFAVSKEVSLKLAPLAVQKGALVIDNSVAFRMDPDCPLVIPEVNPDDMEWHKGIIANPNCSTIQMLVVLKPLHDYAKIKRIVVSTYQAVSGSGRIAIDGLIKETKEFLHSDVINEPQVYKYPITFNCIPQIDVFDRDGYTMEEHKMINETKKILHSTEIEVNPTCVRVPVIYGHSESVNIETEYFLTRDRAVNLLNNAENVKVIDDIENEIYPYPYDTRDKDITMVGRIREDHTIKNGLNMWIVSNNIKKGAALNAVQIAELVIRKNIR